MKATFVLSVLVGFVGALAAAHYVPLASHVRLPSKTTVVANGGRSEQFVIRLPADRIGAAGANGAGLRSGAVGGDVQLPPTLGKAPVLVEHFKVRDADGNVIGLAARHWSANSSGTGTAWSLLIPSRGALLLTAPGEARGALDAALGKAGYKSGSAWNGEVKVAFAADDPAGGAVAAGTDEFADLDGRYSEVWTVTGVSESGELRGTIELDTITRRGS